MNVRLLVLDVDGVLTDGRFFLPPSGDEWKAFSAVDGLGMRLLMNVGVKIALLSGRDSGVVTRRANELGLHACIQGSRDKIADLYALGTQHEIAPDAMAYMGDDLVDLPAMRLVGFSAAPRSARPEVRDAADWVAPSDGGHGAVRDLCEHLLRAMGRWDEQRARFE